MRRLLLPLLAAAALLAPAVRAGAPLLISLDGADWTLRNASGASVPGRVPGGVYTDLRDAGVLNSDFFYGRNDENFRWVGHSNWTYERTFQVDASALGKRVVQLVLDGVDTVGEVRVNGAPLGATSNMFVRWALDARAALRAGDNRVAVELASAPEEARRRYDAHVAARGYAVPPACLPDEYHGECHANHLRKMQASFAWDWGPAFPSSGIWKSVRVEAFDGAVVRGVVPHYERPAGEAPARLNVRAFLDAGGVDAVAGTLRAVVHGLPQGDVAAEAPVNCAPDARHQCVAQLNLTFAQEPPLWWPNGEGEQPLFDLTVSFTSDAGETSARTERVGFRTIALVQDPIDPDDPDKGLSFYFAVNGRPIFAKGSNWIPANVLPELSDDERTVRRLLLAARDTHHNMLRVWGGGVYESDLFYQVADELGLLIWQDLMFACAMYPADDAFLASVREEVRQQVVRLAPRPSVAVWAGNNENEGALVDNWYGTGANFSVYKADYVKLYGETLRPLVLQLDPSRPFVTSSPSNGDATDAAGFVSKWPGDPLYGDVHYYNYVSDGWNADTYMVPRFASEYGFQSLPALATMAHAAERPEDLAVNSTLLGLRQHHPNGYAEMAALVAQRMPLPAHWDRTDGFAAFTFMTEIYQAVATQTQTEHYRRLRSQLMSDGRGHCMGALYWQLNSVWAAPTWASIDFAGRWMPLHHLAGEFFAPVMASAYVDTAHRLRVWAINDRTAPVASVVLQGRAGRWDALPAGPWTNLTEPFTLCAACSQELLSRDAASALSALGCAGDAAACFAQLRLLAVPDAVELGPRRDVLPVPLRDATGLAAPTITVTDVSDELEVTLSTDRPAAFVWLQAGELEGRFSRNAFLMADATARARFLPAEGAATPTPQQLRDALTVTSLASEAAAAAATPSVIMV